MQCAGLIVSFLHPRTISITRPGAQPGSSSVGWQGGAPSSDPSLETVIAKGLKVSIQAKSSSGKNPVGLPADAPTNVWRVFIPKRSAKLGTVQNRDIVTDDLGNRYQVVSDYWNSLGYTLWCQRLEA